LVFTFLVPAHPGSHRKGPLNGCCITESAEQLKIVEVAHNATLQLGSSARLVCRAEGKTRPTVRWYHDGLAVPRAEEHKVRQSDDGSLYFSVVESGDAGLYVCVATNDQGSVNASLRVDVVGTSACS